MPVDRDGLEALSEIPDPIALRRSSGSGRVGADAPPRRGPLPPAPTRVQTNRRRTLLVLASLLWLGVFVVGAGPRRDWASLPPAFLWGQTALWLACVAAVFSLSLKPIGRGFGTSAWALVAVAAGLAAAFGVVSLAWVAPGGSITDAHGVAACFAVTLLATAGPLVLSAFAVQRAFAAAPSFHGAAVGAACGLLGAVAANLHCSAVGGVHVAVAHGAQILVGFVVGGLIGKMVGRA